VALRAGETRAKVGGWDVGVGEAREGPERARQKKTRIRNLRRGRETVVTQVRTTPQLAASAGARTVSGHEQWEESAHIFVALFLEIEIVKEIFFLLTICARKHTSL
jgi:hypothetical protein